jgi:hypothetical protein
MSDLGLSAVKAYGGVAQTLGGMAGGKETGGVSAAPASAIILNTAVGSLTSAGNAAETAVTNAAMGRGDLVDVVTPSPPLKPQWKP